MPARVRLSAPKKRCETDISREIRKALTQLGIPNYRMQAGGYRGRARGLPAGTPDILAHPQISVESNGNPYANIKGTAWFSTPAWIEVKKPGGVPSKEQLAFGDRARNRGEFWLCVESLHEVLAWIKEIRAR